MIRTRCAIWMCLGLLAACGSLVPEAPPAPPQTRTARLGGDIQVSPGILDFGIRKIGTTNDLSLTVTNTDIVDSITVSTIEVTAGTASFQLASVPAIPLLLKAGESAVLKVRFTPAGAAATTGTLTLTSDATTKTVDVALSGAGTSDAPPFVVSPSLIDFGTQRLGTSSATRSVTVSSTGASTSSGLVITKVYSTHPAFSVVGPSTPFPIPSSPDGGTTEALSVTFTPTRRGQNAGELVIEGASDGTGSSGFTVHASLTGVGGQPVLGVSPDSLFFDVKPGTATSFPLTLSNSGNDKLTVSALTMAGDDAASFSLGTVTLPLALQPGGSTPVQVTFSPSASRDHFASLLVQSDDPAKPLLAVDFVGYSPCADLKFSPPLLEFGARLVGSHSGRLTTVLSNNSPFTITLTRLSVQGTGASQFSLVSPPMLPIVLAPKGTQTLDVTFNPSTSGEAAGSAVFICEGSGSPEEEGMTLHGMGINSVLSVSPARLDFGTVDVDAAESSLSQLLVTNVSSDVVTLGTPKLVSTPPNQFDFLVEKEILEPGESSEVLVLYDPTETAQVVGTLSFSTVLPSIPLAAEVGLVGKAVSSLLEVTPADGLLDFGRVDVGTTSSPREVHITNRDSTPRQVTKVESSHGDFQADTSGVKAAIPAGESATIPVTYRPGAAGTAEGELRLFIAGDGEPVTLSLKGNGRSIGLQGGSAGGCASAGGGLAALGLLVLAAWGSRRRARSPAS